MQQAKYICRKCNRVKWSGPTHLPTCDACHQLMTRDMTEAPPKRYVCVQCSTERFTGYVPNCSVCNRFMQVAPIPPGKRERPHDDYGRYEGETYTCDPLSTDTFEKSMRRWFGSEAGLVGYAEVGTS